MSKAPKKASESNLTHIQLLSEKIDAKKREEQKAWEKIQNIEKEIYESKENGKKFRDKLIEIFLHEFELLEAICDETRIEEVKNIKVRIEQIDQEIQDLCVELLSAQKDREASVKSLNEFAEIIPLELQEENLEKKSSSFWSALLRLDSNAQSSLLFVSLLVISVVSVIHITVIGVSKERIGVAGAGVGGVAILWRMKIRNELERNKEAHDYEMLLKTFTKLLGYFNKMNILKDNNAGTNKIIDEALSIIKNLNQNLSSRYSGNSSTSDIENSYIRMDDNENDKSK